MVRFLAAFLLCVGACLTTASAQEVTPPTFNGAAMKIFITRLKAEAKRLAIECKYPYEELSEETIIAFRIDTAGRVDRWRFLDNTCEGSDSVGVAPASEATKRLLTEAFGNMQGEWQPACRGGRKISFHQTWRLQLPIKQIEQALNPDPLLFLGEDPRKSFFPWLRPRVRYDERFKGIDGLVHVRFFVEADGGITIGEVVETPDAKLAKEVVRVIRNSRGKWTPRKVDGVAQRTPYEVRINYVDEVWD